MSSAASPAPLRAIGAAFALPGQFREAAPYGNGHINDTYAAVYEQNGRRVRYIHQRINDRVFKQPAVIMDTIARVTDHLRRKLAERGMPDAERRTLTLVPAADGRPCHVDADGKTWRTYRFIEGATTYDVITDARQARQAAAAFGAFQEMLRDLPGPRLAETIPFFHHTPARFEALEQAIAADARNRAASCREEIAFCLARKAMTDRLIRLQAEGRIPERITHNDTKINNVMLDDRTGEGLCVIDLDTVMPGLALYDFGDMVRTCTSPAAEDETNLERVAMRMPVFRELLQGYLSTAGRFLTPAERDHLPFSGKLITFEIGIRFLTDYLQGDVYFKIHRPDHNLARCRTQFALVASIERQEKAMADEVKRLADAGVG
ncbi:MAG: N-acetylhexosamine 1-kinase [candidate division TA06 bacterium ADurb.Bin417]|uniref:N-acetylhexosamine 1-kinase n=1 Tax=candidate division TA06 bacterium ADurb.Bin417 TaxID=1852828 RepID=A0A1V5M9L0_UNCT6|nr:MAG: N-acetylhexosamine 1-kinase [candidate division TA06 bacterium ADurb.Bin417]